MIDLDIINLQVGVTSDLEENVIYFISNIIFLYLSNIDDLRVPDSLLKASKRVLILYDDILVLVRGVRGGRVGARLESGAGRAPSHRRDSQHESERRDHTQESREM